MKVLNTYEACCEAYAEMLSPDIFEIITIVISAIAVFVSIASAIFTYCQNNKHTHLNLQSRYFEKIFDEYLIKNIPISKEYIKLVNNKLDGADRLINTLDEMKRSSLYFKYNNESFYKNLKSKIDELTSYLTDSSNRNLDSDEYSEVNTEVKKRIEEIYQIIHTNYAGSEKKK